MSERIDHTNYEAWLLDRLEGNLSPAQEAELELFLALHPELAPEGGALPFLKADELSLPGKNALKRSLPPEGMVNKTSLDDHLIAKLEGDLSPEQLLALEKFLYEHPEYAGVSRLYALTRSMPDALAYAGKEKLEQHLPPHGMPDAGRLEDFLVARLEGDFTAEQERALDAYIGNDPAAQRMWVLIQSTKVNTDARSYPSKAGLKKGGRVIAITFNRVYTRLAVAASIAILFSVGIWYMSIPVDPHAGQFSQLRTVDKESTPATESSDQETADQGSSDQEEQPGGQGGAPASGGAAVGHDPALAAPRDRITAPRRHVPEGSNGTAPVPSSRDIMDRESPQLASARVIAPPVKDPARELRTAEIDDVPVSLAEAPEPAADPQAVPFSAMLASTVRDKVLDQPAPESRPIDVADAFAVVDKGLKAVGGARSGLTVDRSEGRVRSFGLRIGSLAVSTGTGL